MLFSLISAAQTTAPKNAIVLEGNYRKQNIYIQNPHAPGDSGFCTEKVTVNEKEIPFENSSAFEIRLDSLGLEPNAPLRIVIAHKDNCKPKVLNPGVDLPKYFEFKNVSVSGDSLLQWTVSNEEGKSPFIIEQYRWNKWIPVGEAASAGKGKENSYTFVLKPHSGKNTFRVKKRILAFEYRISEPVSFKSTIKPVKFTIDKATRQIVFSESTMYELYDTSGNLVKRGTGTSIDYSRLKNNLYYLNYDVWQDEIELIR